MTGCREKPPKSDSGEGYNLFNPRRTESPRRDVPRQHSERLDNLARGLQKEFSPDAERTNQAFLYYGSFFVVLAIIVAGLVYWQIWRRNRAEWALNDPMALIKELNYVHQLSDQEKRLMQEISDRNALPTPLKLFVEPKFLLEALENDLHISDRSSVRQLLSKLFDIAFEENDGVSGVLTDSAA